MHEGRSCARRSRRRGQCLRAFALGALAGVIGSQLLPVADTLAAALEVTGVGPSAAHTVVLALFVTGGVEGALILRPVVSQWRDRGGSA